MTEFANFDRRMFDLGFAAGTDIDEDPPTIELQTRVLQWQIGFILGRSFAGTAKSGNFAVYANTVGRLGGLYGIDIDALLAALALTQEQRDVVCRAFDQK